MSIFEERPVRTIEESELRHTEAARRYARRSHYIRLRALRWLKRHEPEVLERIVSEAHRKIPNPSGRRDRLRVAA